jgi:putative phosphoesterase
MNIGVISDTHSSPIPKQVLEAFKKVDFIIHAGDFCDERTIDALAKIKEVKGVWGNMDPSEVRKIFPARQLISCGKFTVGVYHGEGSRQKVLERVAAEFKKDKVDVVVFGHSHQPFNEKIGGVLYFNPGSPNDSISAPYCSYGILDVTEQGVVGKIIKLS